MIKDDIISELEYVPEANLSTLYDLIHYFRLGLASEKSKSLIEDDLKIDIDACLKTLNKVKARNFSSFTEIEDVDVHIQRLKDEIN